jgi:Transglycosylase SLT domain
MRWVEYYAAIYRVPIELVEAIIDEESGWNPYAVSSKGAAGIMQLMPGTAVRFGVHNRFRIDENIHGAYLAWLSQRFKGDLRLMTAAYYVANIRFLCADSIIPALMSRDTFSACHNVTVQDESPSRNRQGTQTAR